ncbi:DUF3592 domain-containing protein [Arthrobacter glacialis]|uniref:DUF3592 domain-containing protein n=1 Tax=Arthrobacter glacialis TaxID=1664 RepID=A0A2S3ZSJ9_ARTGL|nr:DUF3592 domain-containing protein [Arthrobacter glacialis]POH72059.1 hypothetical protein CVS27_17930 [Arthrobacter glacialis]
MGQRFRSWAVAGVSAIALAALTTAGVVTLGGGLAEQGNASALSAAGSTLVSTAGTVKANAGDTEWSQMPVRFITEGGEAIETMVWTRQGNRNFDVGELVELDYVSQYPSAARLADGQGGPAKSMGTILTGAGILAAAFLLTGAWIWDLVARSKRRAGKRTRPLRQP